MSGLFYLHDQPATRDTESPVRRTFIESRCLLQKLAFNWIFERTCKDGQELVHLEKDDSFLITLRDELKPILRQEFELCLAEMLYEWQRAGEDVLLVHDVVHGAVICSKPVISPATASGKGVESTKEACIAESSHELPYAAYNVHSSETNQAHSRDARHPKLVITNYRLALRGNSKIWLHVPLAVISNIEVAAMPSTQALEDGKQARVQGNTRHHEIVEHQTAHRSVAEQPPQAAHKNRNEPTKRDTTMAMTTTSQLHAPAVVLQTRDYRQVWIGVAGGLKVCANIVRLLEGFRFDSLRWLVDSSTSIRTDRTVCVCVCMYAMVRVSLCMFVCMCVSVFVWAFMNSFSVCV